MFNFADRRLPFNQLDTDITGTTTIEDALTKAKLNWTVENRPIFNEQGMEIPGYRANVRTDTLQTLGIVGNRYSVVQNADAFTFTEELLGEGAEYQMAGLFQHGSAMWLLAKLPQKQILNDTYDPYLVFVNSHNGLGSIKVASCPIRIACSNALNINLKKAQRSWSAMHAGNITYKLEEARAALRLQDAYMNEFDATAQSLSQRKFTDAMFEGIIDKIFPVDVNKDSERKMKNVAEAKEDLFKCLNAPDVAQYKGTAFAPLLAVTDWVDHSTPARMTSSYEESRWEKIALGHSTVDNFVKEIIAA